MLYYGSSHNHENALPLELVCNAMRLPSLALGSGFEGREKDSNSMLQVLVDEVAQPSSPTSNNDACNIDVSNVIVLVGL